METEKVTRKLTFRGRVPLKDWLGFRVSLVNREFLKAIDSMLSITETRKSWFRSTRSELPRKKVTDW
jgi:hypothetical protein